jgi:hypothetical protein
VRFFSASSDITRAARSSASSTSGGGVSGTPWGPCSMPGDGVAWFGPGAGSSLVT